MLQKQKTSVAREPAHVEEPSASLHQIQLMTVADLEGASVESDIEKLDQTG